MCTSSGSGVIKYQHSFSAIENPSGKRNSSRCERAVVIKMKVCASNSSRARWSRSMGAVVEVEVFAHTELVCVLVLQPAVEELVKATGKNELKSHPCT
jgi:hypothetical protein